MESTNQVNPVAMEERPTQQKKRREEFNPDFSPGRSELR
jgi:hypothetical protein